MAMLLLPPPSSEGTEILMTVIQSLTRIFIQENVVVAIFSTVCRYEEKKLLTLSEKLLTVLTSLLTRSMEFDNSDKSTSLGLLDKTFPPNKTLG